jgi:transposase
MAIYINDVPRKGWSKKGTKCFIKSKNKTIRLKRVTLGLYVTRNKQIDFTLTEGSLKSQKFLTFMKKVKLKTKNKLTMFMDNAIIHKSKIFNKYVADNNIKIIYNVPYQSHLNPVEYLFSLIRKKLLDSDTSSIEKIGKVIYDFKKNVDMKVLTNIFKKCITDINN